MNQLSVLPPAQTPRPRAEERGVTVHERQRPAALHEYRLLDAPADDELAAVVRVARVVGSAGAGHGAGLSTCRRIVERRTGRIRVGAGDDGGTTVASTPPGT